MEETPAMLRKSCREIFEIPRLGAKQLTLYNPRVNYRSNGSSGKEGK